MKDSVLIDTSIWIAYFQSTPQPGLTERVDDVLANNKVCVPRIVLAELIQGASSKNEIAVIRDFMAAFQILGERDGTWLEAGQLSFALKKKGKTINLADCYIAVIAKDNNCAIMTLDKHFKDIQKELALRIHSV